MSRLIPTVDSETFLLPQPAIDALAIALGSGTGDGGVALQSHIDDPTPHPAYDVDIQSLSGLFENGLS